jgi:hypothetical protein
LRIIPLELKRSPQRRGYSGWLRRDDCDWRTTFRPIRAMLLPFVIDAPDLRGVSTLRPARCTARRTHNTRRLTPSTKAPSQYFLRKSLHALFVPENAVVTTTKPLRTGPRHNALSSGEGPEEADTMSDAKTYREYAADCVRIAQSMDAKDRETLLRMAKAWEDRARKAERNETRARSDQ